MRYNSFFDYNAPTSMIPIVIENDGGTERSFDIFSGLLRQRIIMLNGPIDNHTASLIIAQLLFLESENPDSDISMYINSPGGSVVDGLAIYDTMQYIKPDVTTVCIGMAASMGSFLLAAGAKGKRLILPNAEVMIHQPSGGMRGQNTDIQIQAKRLNLMQDRLYKIYSELTGKTVKEITKDMERDNWILAEDAVKYGLVDKIITKNERSTSDGK